MNLLSNIRAVGLRDALFWRRGSMQDAPITQDTLRLRIQHLDNMLGHMMCRRREAQFQEATKVRERFARMLKRLENREFLKGSRVFLKK